MITIQTGKIKAISEVLGVLIREKDLSRKQKYWFYRLTVTAMDPLHLH